MDERPAYAIGSAGDPGWSRSSSAAKGRGSAA